jgi:hypothetical protein
MKHHQGAFDAALREYGSWSRALMAAGVINKAIPRKTRLGLLRELRDVMARSSAAIPEPLRVCLTHYFGSVRNAIAALKTDRKLLGGWSKTKITATLARMHRSKEKLGYTAVRRDSPALVSAAEAYFGSWGRAEKIASGVLDIWAARIGRLSMPTSRCFQRRYGEAIHFTRRFFGTLGSGDFVVIVLSVLIFGENRCSCSHHSTGRH